VRTLTREEFAAEAGAAPEVVDRLAAIGAINVLADGRYDARDEIVASTVRAMLDAGIALEDLVSTLEDGRFGIRSVGQIFSEPAPRTEARYDDIVAALGRDASMLPSVYAAFGLPEPEPDDHPRVDEVDAVVRFVELWSLVDPTGRAHVRVARMIGDATRRIAEGWLDVWDEVAQPDPTTQGAPTVGPKAHPQDPTDPEQNPSIGMAELARRLVSLVHERQVEATLNGRIISAVEWVLAESGRLPPRAPRPPAVAFVDLTGYTTLAEERGDDAAADAASGLYEVAEQTVRAHDGRIVKQLGDGVLIRFPDATRALRAITELMPAVAAAGLPAVHCGVAAGPVIVRDGDVFGRTVNLAARLSAAAQPGEILVEEGVVVALPGGTARFERLDRIALDGFAEPVAVWRVGGVATSG
jgi:adenylate cyclase